MTHVPWHMDDSEITESVHGVESVELYSVGIDIGTTTTHLMISRLLARRAGGNFSSKFHITDKESVYQSEIVLTPYVDANTIDTERLEAIVDDMYARSRFEPSDIDTGAVIVTGEASKKVNAAAIAELFSERAGAFVCATAGPDLEALMAAHGSGAVEHALETNSNVLHIDIGGGTTKFGYIVNGFVEETASINIGARLVEFAGDDGSISRVEDAGRIVADREDIDVSVGQRLSEAERQNLAGAFADLLFAAISGDFRPPLTEFLVTEQPELHPFDVITFSGGVAEYVYNRNQDSYQDLGPEFGQAIRRGLAIAGYESHELTAGIRATAIGSTEDNVQLSGNTILISNDALLPLRNVPMVPFVVDEGDSFTAVRDTIRERLQLYDVDVVEEPFAFGFHLHGAPSYGFLNTVIRAAIDGWNYIGNEQPLILAFENDVAMNSGRLAKKQLDHDVVSVDGVDLDQFGYIDIGRPIEDTGAVPLTVKSLVFKG